MINACYTDALKAISDANRLRLSGCWCISMSESVLLKPWMYWVKPITTFPAT